MIYNKAYITVCGDVNQSNGISPTNPSWNTLIELLDAQFIKFNTCYRSSEAVVKSFNSRMTNTQYGPAENYEGAVDGYVKHIRSLNSQNSVIFNDFDVEETMLLFLSDDDEKLISENAYLRRFERMSAFEVKGMEFNNVILVINGYDLTSAADQRFRYMLISRALKNFISIGLI
jgi:DNA helicase IV